MKDIYSYDIGDKIVHKEYGVGRITGINQSGNNLTWKVAFHDIGEKKIDITQEQLVDEEKDDIDIKKIKKALSEYLDEKFSVEDIEIANKWEGGKIIFKPGMENLKPYEMPIDVFFHKIVMIRDRLRVLEQRINSEKKLTDREKINIQQYITRIYGSLTSFNQLFRNRKDWFTGEAKK